MSWLFNANTERLDLASAPATDHPLTIACWFSADSLAGTSEWYLVDLNDGAATNSRAILINNGTANNLAIQGRCIDSTTSGPTNATAVDTWYHVVYRCISATSRYVYVNGSISSQSTSSKAPATPNHVRIGNVVGANDAFMGRIAHVAIWSVDIGDAAAQALGAGGNPLDFPTGLEAYWPMNTSEAAPTDASGNGYTLTVTGATYDADNPTVDAATSKYVKLLAHSSAASATGVEGVVLNSTRDTVIGEFTGQAFEASLEGSPGEAVLLIAVEDITPDGNTLTTADEPLVVAYNSTDGTVGLGSATVVEV
jgi:hypothetical protein